MMKCCLLMTLIGVRKVDRNGIISTISGSERNTDSLMYPSSVFQYKNEMYIAGRSGIRKIDRNGMTSHIGQHLKIDAIFINR